MYMFIPLVALGAWIWHVAHRVGALGYMLFRPGNPCLNLHVSLGAVGIHIYNGVCRLLCALHNVYIVISLVNKVV